MSEVSGAEEYFAESGIENPFNQNRGKIGAATRRR